MSLLELFLFSFYVKMNINDICKLLQSQLKASTLFYIQRNPLTGNHKFEMSCRNLPRVIAPTTKPWAATRMWIRWRDILVLPLLFNLYNPYATTAAKPANPVKQTVTSMSDAWGHQDDFIINQRSIFFL